MTGRDIQKTPPEINQTNKARTKFWAFFSVFAIIKIVKQGAKMIKHLLKPIKKFRRSYLPGIVTGSADDDPSAISTYSVAGATTGFSQLWLLLVSTPLLIAIHKMTGRIGDVAKKGLISLIKEKFGLSAAFLCLIILVLANLFTLVADIIGMAAGFQLLTGKNYIYFIVPVVILIWYIIVFDNYQHIARYFFWFSGILLAYIFSGILAKPDWWLVLKSVLWPKINFSFVYLSAGLALLGSTFSPYTFFWQTREELEERHTVKNIQQTDRAISLGFIWSNLIAFFIMVAAATVVTKTSLEILTVKDVAQALAPLAGGWAAKLFGLGLIGSGILAIPILAASSAYATAEFFNWPNGLSGKPSRAKGFYSVITAGFLICLVALFFDLHPIKLMFYSQALVGILAPVLVYFILKIAGSKKIMGAYRSHWSQLAAGWFLIALLILADILLLYFLI